MPKFAPVCPIHVYEAMYEASQNDTDIVGDYFLLLAHDVLANQERYRNFFEQMRAESDITIIMDNSVIELGSSVDMWKLVEAVNVVHADVLVIPDALKDGAKTSRMAEVFVTQWLGVGNDIEQDCDLMFVPQGDHQTQWEVCAKNAYQFLLPHIQWIGIPRNLTGRIYLSRCQAMEFLISTFGKEVKYHMLGFSDDANDDVTTCRIYHEFLEGIDSAVPLRITEDLEDPIQAVGKRGNWWDTAEYTEQMGKNVLEMRKRLVVQPW